MADLAIQSLTIYLARSGVTLTDLVNPDYSSGPNYKIMINPAVPAYLYIAPPHPGPPEWAVFFDGYLESSVFGENSSTAAALIVEVRQ